MLSPERIVWVPAAEQLPPDDATVLIHAPTDAGEPVGMGWYCGASATWHTSEGLPLDAADVKHWARRPNGPPPPFRP